MSVVRTGAGLVLSAKPFGERDALVEILCAERGRIRGLVKGAGSRKGSVAAALQPFNTVNYEHFRRLEGQLGSLSVELAVSRAGLWLGGGGGGYVVAYLSELLSAVLPEEHPYEGLSGQVETLLSMSDVRIPTLGLGWRAVVGFELMLLHWAGYGLRLDRESAVGAGELAYVSPASGRVVDRATAKGWESRLLELPACLGGPDCEELADFAKAWRLTGYFLDKALHGRRLEARGRLAGYFERGIGRDGIAEVIAA